MSNYKFLKSAKVSNRDGLVYISTVVENNGINIMDEKCKRLR